MKQIILLALATTIASIASAKDVYYCTSNQTNYSYVFDISEGTVDVSDPNGNNAGSADVSYLPGHGDDVMYYINQGKQSYGMINGEERIRASFSHSIFENPIEDNDIQCSRTPNPMIESVSCLHEDYRLEIGFVTIGGKGNNSKRYPFFTLFENDTVISPAINNIELVEAGYDGSFFDAYVWAFHAEDGVVGLALPGPREVAAGVYTSAKADLHLEVGGHVMSGSTVPCTITLK